MHGSWTSLDEAIESVEAAIAEAFPDLKNWGESAAAMRAAEQAQKRFAPKPK